VAEVNGRNKIFIVNAVEIKNVSKSYGDHLAVSNLDLNVPEGSVYGFIGPNGSGKTTTIRMILHIILPDTGTIDVMGKAGTRAANDQIGYLPEERGLYKKMTVGRLLLYYATIKRLQKADAKAQADLWLERMGLQDWKNKKIEALSKGMAQKVQFIATVISRPKLVILDEPFSGLDPVNLDVIRQAILALKAQGTTVIFSTHDMEMAERMCDSIFMIYQGRKVLDGTLNEIQEQYGEDTIRMSGEGDKRGLVNLPGVLDVRDFGQYQELRFTGNPQDLLKQLVGIIDIQSFAVSKPSLHDIFVRIASPKGTPNNE
jgi:ABC-2 type transport system ATP-binding protein